MDEDFAKNAAVLFEIKSSIKFLKNGLAELQKITADNDFYAPPFIFLSTGFERLFKSMLCLSFKERNGRYPTFKELMKNHNGHDLVFLKNEVAKICINNKIPIIEEDYEIINNEKIIDEIITILSEYGLKARYFNLDVILSKEQKFDVNNEFAKIEDKLANNHLGNIEFFKMLDNPIKIREIYNTSSKLIVSKLELFIRALSRQFIHGNFSSNSKSYMFEIELFSALDDHEIGTRQYASL